MARIVRTSTAKLDIFAIFGQIAADNFTAAEKWIDELDKTLSSLSQSPHIGEAVDHLQTGLRRYSFRNYLLFYRPIENGIELRRVLHGARKVEDLF
jgi:toxin ParE1/3/4